MADETTPFLGLVKPEVNGPQTENVWGYDINANFDKIDARFVELTVEEAPLDGDIYGRRQGAWSRTVLQTDFEAAAEAAALAAEAGATKNAEQDAAIATKANVDHTHIAEDIADFSEAVDDRVSGLLTAGPNITLQYDDTINKLQISSTGTGGGGGGGVVTNGDYGDITVTNLGATWTIDPGVVTYAKMQNVAANKLLGGATAGVVQEIPCTAAGRALLDDDDAAAQRTTLGLGTAATSSRIDLQTADPTLTALADLTGTAGLVEQTGIDVFTKRALGISTAVSVPTFADTELRYQPKDQTLLALANLDAAPGLLEQTAQDFFAKRPTGTSASTHVLTRADGDGRYAQLDSPVFTGDARAVTPASTDNDTSIATTAFVKAAAVAKTGDTMSGSLTVNGNFATNQINCTALYPSNIQMPINGPIYLYNHGASSACYIIADSNGTFHVVNGTGGLSSKLTITPAGAAAFSGNVSANIFTGNAVNSNGNSSTAGTHYAAAASITNINCTNIAAANNGNFNNGDVAGQWRVGGLHSYGNIYAVGAISCGGAMDCYGLTDHGDFTCTNTAYITGPCFAGGFFATSDERLKEDLQTVDDPGAILEATKVWGFKWKEKGERDYGMMAQEVIDVLPSAVVHDEDKDLWAIDYSRYVPILIAELKLLRARVAELEAA